MTEFLAGVESGVLYGALALYFAAAALYFLFAVAKGQKMGRLGWKAAVAAFALQTLCLAARGVRAGHLPFTSQYEFALSFAWGIALCFLIFERRFEMPVLGAFVCPLCFLIIGYAAMQSREVRELMPALQSRWLAFHVSTAIVSYGAFGVAFAVALAMLFGGKLTGRRADEEKMDLLIYRAIALGFLFLTLCIVTGAIWAKRAWGTYWNWDPKETWSLITWIIYAVFLHLRLSKGFGGRKAAVFAVVGFACVIFTYIGVNTLLTGLHSYA